MIYYLDNVDQVEEEDLQEMLPFLSPERRETQSRYRFAKSRVQSALAYLLLRYGLIKDYGHLSVPLIEKDEKGKLFFRDDPHIHFNLSHCDKAVACVFGSAPVGVDVQHMVPYKESLAKRIMTPEEREQTLVGDCDGNFTRLWTLKEAYGKCLGVGICYSMSEHSLPEGRNEEGYILRSRFMDSFYLSYCSREEQPIQRLSLSQLKGVFLALPPNTL